MYQKFLEPDLSIEEGLATTAKDFHWLEKSVPCQHACPTNTDIPGYLAAIAVNDFETAYRLNLRDNVFPAVLGRICTRPCEKVCRHGRENLGDPVAICHSKRSAADFTTLPLQKFPIIANNSKKRIAIIGAGPAGLAAARDLAILGYSVTAYERHQIAGGMLTQTIPPFRLPRDVVTQEVEQIEHQGVNIICNTEIGKDIQLLEIMENNDAIILACGCTISNRLNLKESETDGVFQGSDFLQTTITGKNVIVGKRVVVIGGGFTAVDCARTALHSGADSVDIYYRRQQQDMRATPNELEALIEEGATIQFMSSLQEIVVDNGTIKSLIFIRNRLRHDNAELEQLEGSEFEIEADVVLIAIGQSPSWDLLEQAYKCSGVEGFTNEDFSLLPKTSVKKIFVAGDQGTGSSSVIEAIASGKECATAVDEYLIGFKKQHRAVSIAPGRKLQRNVADNMIPLQKMAHIPVSERSFTNEVEHGFTRDTAQLEARRCYLCNYKYEIDHTRCIYCNLCCEVKPQPDCILHVQALDFDDQGRIVGYHEPALNFDPANEFVYRINPDSCIRCNLCLEICPVDCISVSTIHLDTRPI